jgi:peptidoglycan/LPS O-acetylase OafA/YrhL
VPSQQRIPGLDGLRGLAVALVVVFHTYPGLLPGGFVGVDVFFVLSGYLITGWLVRRLPAADRRPPRPVLRTFWLGRVRRLFPELAAVLVAVCVVAGFAPPSFSAGLRAQVAAALASGTNWLLIAHGQDYFATFAVADGRPQAPALQHLWSLGVEEQFYLVWPLVLCGLLRRRRPGDRMLPWLIAATACGSFALMAQGAANGSADYYNTLTHCGGLLAGSATALLLPMERLLATGERVAERAGATRYATGPGVLYVPAGPPLIPDATAPGGAAGDSGDAGGSGGSGEDAGDGTGDEGVPVRTVRLLGRLGLGGIVLIVAVSVCMKGDTTAPERGGIALASLAALPVLLAAVCPRTDVARILTWRPAVYLGERSYGVYLWHWPLIVLLGSPGDGAAGGVLRGVAELWLPVLLAGLSRRWIATPAGRISRVRLREWCVSVRGRGYGVRQAARVWRSRAVLLLGTAMVTPVVFGLARAPSVDPAESALRAQIAAGSAVATSSMSGVGAAAGSAAGSGTGDDAGLGRPLIPMPGLGTLPPSGVPDAALGGQVTAIGDSVLLAGAAALADRLPGIVIDAKVGRQMWDVQQQLAELADRGELRRYVVLALGTNGSFDASTLDDVRSRIGAERVLVLVSVHVPRSWQDEVNTQYAAYVAHHPGTLLVDWNATISPYPALLWPDETHPRPLGAQVYADLLAWDLERADG